MNKNEKKNYNNTQKMRNYILILLVCLLMFAQHISKELNV